MASLYLRSRIASLSAVALLAASLASAQVYKAPESDVEAKTKAPVTCRPSPWHFPPPCEYSSIPQPEKSASPQQRSSRNSADPSTGSCTRSNQTVTIKTTASGMRMMELDESFMNYSVIRINADGTLSESCVIGPKAASDLVLKPVKAETQKLEEQ